MPAICSFYQQGDYMKILITGATGFIGQYLVSLLRAEHELLLVSRQPELAAKQLAVDNSKVIQLKQLNSLDGVDAIINLAGESLAAKRWSVEQKRRISESRWLMTETLLEKLKKEKVIKLRDILSIELFFFLFTQNT